MAPVDVSFLTTVFPFESYIESDLIVDDEIVAPVIVGAVSVLLVNV